VLQHRVSEQELCPDEMKGFLTILGRNKETALWGPWMVPVWWDPLVGQEVDSNICAGVDWKNKVLIA